MKTRKSLVRVISMMLILVLMLGGMPVVALDNTPHPAPPPLPMKRPVR